MGRPVRVQVSLAAPIEDIQDFGNYPTALFFLWNVLDQHTAFFLILQLILQLYWASSIVYLELWRICQQKERPFVGSLPNHVWD